jgi:hypothetical protein
MRREKKVDDNFLDPNLKCDVLVDSDFVGLAPDTGPPSLACPAASSFKRKETPTVVI